MKKWLNKSFSIFPEKISHKGFLFSILLLLGIPIIIVSMQQSTNNQQFASDSKPTCPLGKTTNPPNAYCVPTGDCIDYAREEGYFCSGDYKDCAKNIPCAVSYDYATPKPKTPTPTKNPTNPTPTTKPGNPTPTTKPGTCYKDKNASCFNGQLKGWVCSCYINEHWEKANNVCRRGNYQKVVENSATKWWWCLQWSVNPPK